MARPTIARRLSLAQLHVLSLHVAHYSDLAVRAAGRRDGRGTAQQLVFVSLLLQRHLTKLWRMAG